jgi:formate dehydrogenase assembly factor FdhD
MDMITRKRDIVRYNSNGSKDELEELLIEETRLKIIINGRDFVSVRGMTLLGFTRGAFQLLFPP